MPGQRGTAARVQNMLLFGCVAARSCAVQVDTATGLAQLCLGTRREKALSFISSPSLSPVCKMLAVITLCEETRNLSVILGVLYTCYYQKTPERKANFPPFIHPCSGSFSKQLKDRILRGFLSPVRKETFMSCLGLVSY